MKKLLLLIALSSSAAFAADPIDDAIATINKNKNVVASSANCAASKTRNLTLREVLGSQNIQEIKYSDKESTGHYFSAVGFGYKVSPNQVNFHDPVAGTTNQVVYFTDRAVTVEGSTLTVVYKYSNSNRTVYQNCLYVFDLQ